MPAVSVVIPTRNRAGTLDRAIASIVEPAPSTSFEVVVVDNASDDATGEVLGRWAARDRRIRTLREDEVGSAPALRTGTEAATGSLVLFTDDDVVVEPGWIDAYAAFFGRHPDAAVAGGPITPFPRTGRWPGWYDDVAAPSLGSVLHDGERPLGPGEHVWGANMAVRASTFERIGGWRTDLGVRDVAHPKDPGQNQDVELQYRARDRGEQVWFCPGARVRHLVDVRSSGWMLRRAFVNGRNSRNRRPWPGMPDVPPVPPGSAGGVAAAVARSVGVVVAALRFRIDPTRAAFRGAWVRAWRLGRTIEDVSGDRPDGRRTLAWPAARIAIRAAARLADRR
jgi:glucosyl-dolichyl phosphate glucuronosyltransferase